MDATTLIIGLSATVVIGAVMMVIAKFGFGGETEYEQQIARQKQVLLDDTKGKAADKKKVKADKKKKGKPKGEVTGQTSGSEFEGESGRDVADVGPESQSAEDALSHPHIEYDPDPVIIEPKVTAVPKATKKSKKPAPGKSILHNRDETPLVRSESASVGETVFSETAPPKDDLELKHVKAKKSGKKEKQKQVHVVVEEPVPAVDEVIVPAAVKTLAAAPPQVVEELVVARKDAPLHAPAPSSRKSKAKSAVTSDLQSILNVVTDAPLTRDELQTLIESLLAKQESEDNWTTKSARPDPMAVLRKQLEEVQAALAEEQNNLTSAHAKLKEINSKWVAAERSGSGATAQVQELQRRMQTTQEQHKAALKALTDAGYQDKQKVEQQVEIISQLTEENLRLKQSVANTDEVTQMQNQIRSLTGDKQKSSARVAEADKAATDAKHDLARLQESCKAAEADKQELKKRCDELGQRLAQAETQNLEAQSRATETEKNMRNLQDHLRTQSRDKEREVEVLMDELTKVKAQQLQSPATNGSHTTNGLPADVTELEGQVSRLQQTIDDKDIQVNSLTKQLAVAKSCLADVNSKKQNSADETSQRKEAETKVVDLQAQIQTLKDKNNELRRKNWSLNDSLEKAESCSVSAAGAERDLEDKLCAINELKDRNSRLLTQNNELQERCDGVSTLHNELSSLRREINDTKASLDNKDVIIKGLEESVKAEKQKLSQQSKSDSEAKKLREQIASLNKELQKMRHDKQTLETKVAELERPAVAEGADTESSEVTSLVQYKTTLTEVETMLDGLSVRVEAEHSKISTVLSSKDQELSAVQQRLDVALKEGGNHSTQAAKESAKVQDLTSQLQMTTKKVEELEKASAGKDEAAAMAASGEGDDSGTCV